MFFCLSRASRWYRSSLKRSWKGTERGIVEVQWKPRKGKGKRDLGVAVERRQNGKKQSGGGSWERHTPQLPPIWSGSLLQCPLATGREVKWGLECREGWTSQTELWRLPFCFLPHCAAYADFGAGKQWGKWICRIGKIPSRQEGSADLQKAAKHSLSLYTLLLTLWWRLGRQRGGGKRPEVSKEAHPVYSSVGKRVHIVLPLPSAKDCLVLITINQVWLMHSLAVPGRKMGEEKNNPHLMIIKRGDKTKNVPELQLWARRQ